MLDMSYLLSTVSPPRWAKTFENWQLKIFCSNRQRNCASAHPKGNSETRQTKVHMSETATDKKTGFLSTRQAAASLGVALSTVQTWVETGALPAWKTAGGHRRIPSDAVEAIRLRQHAILGAASIPDLFKVLVVEDDPVVREIYRRQFADWRLPVQVFMAEDGFEGLILVGRHAPDLIVTDLAMPKMDGFALIHRLKSCSAVMLGTIVIVVTALSPTEIQAHGGLPAGIPVYPKPIPFAALRLLVEHMARRITTT